MAEPLDYVSPPDDPASPPPAVSPAAASRLYTIASLVCSGGAAAIARSFHQGVFDDYRHGGSWANWGLAGVTLSLAGVTGALLALISRPRAWGVIALAVAIAVIMYGGTAPFPKNVPMP